MMIKKTPTFAFSPKNFGKKIPFYCLHFKYYLFRSLRIFVIRTTYYIFKGALLQRTSSSFLLFGMLHHVFKLN